MNLVDRIAEARGGSGEEQRYAVDQWINDYLIPAAGQFSYGGNSYTFGLNQTLTGSRASEVSSTLPGYTSALLSSPPAFAAQMVRALVLSQARFTFRNPPSSFTPRKTFGNRDLGVLERPWPNGTTGELLARMEWHEGLAGNAFVTNWQPGRLRVLRPDWTAILHGSKLEPDEAGWALDGELIGYAYCNGGFNGANPNPVRSLRVEEVAHWSPLPDPMSPARGMSWITPAIREIQGDRAATEHKLKFFESGATPNMVVKGIPAATKQQFDAIVDQLEERHTGVRNAYRTLYLTGGADVTVVGADLKQMDFKQTQGAGETRIAFLSRVPAPILGIAEGLAGSSLNAGNFGMARRIFADSWVYPTLQDAARALAPLVQVPPDAELWFETGDMPLLREDAKDAAEIESIKASTIGGLIKDGFVPESAVAAVMGQNLSLLKHSGLVSVQMQEPGQAAPSAQAPNDPSLSANGKPTSKPAAPGGGRAEDPFEDDERYSPNQPRVPSGPFGGEWTSGGGMAFNDPGEARKFVKSHYGSWHSSLTRAEDSALSMYQSPGFELMNGQLRGNSVAASAADLKRARKANHDLTVAISRAPSLPAALKVYRGFSVSQFDLKPGSVVTDKAFASTSLVKGGTSAVGLHGAQALATITIPKGMRVGAGYSRELILAPGTRFRIKSVTKKGGATHVEMEVVP